MLANSRILSKNVTKFTSYSRSFSKLNALVTTEEFPYDYNSVVPKALVAPVVSESRLANGIKVITKDYLSPIVSLKFAVMGGSGAESESQKGAAQLLSVGAFAGNKYCSGLKVIRELEDIGATVSSTADKEKIVYDVTVVAESVASAVEIVKDSIISPPKADYVLKELKPSAKIAYDNFAKDYPAQISEMLHEAAFGETSSLGASLYAPNLSKLSIADVLDYRRTYFTPSNIVVTGNGISTAALKALLDEEWGTEGEVVVGGGKEVKRAATCPYVGGDMKVRKDLGGQTYLGLGFPTPSGEDSKPYAVLSEMLASKSSTSTMYTYSTGGLMELLVSGPSSEASSKLEAVVTELKAIASKSAAEVDAIKNRVALKKLLALDGEGVTGSLLSASTQGASAASIADVRSVTAASVTAAAKSLLSSIPSYAVLGKTAGAPSYLVVQKWMK